MSWYQHSADGLLLQCLVQAGAASDQIVGLHDDRLRIRLQAPPAGGQANQRLCRLLAEEFSIAGNRVQILRGHGSRRKTILLTGVSELSAGLRRLGSS